MKRIFAILLLLLCAAPARAQGALEVTIKASEQPGAPEAGKVKLYSSSKALVIGIDHYIHKSTWPVLSMAIKDAEAVAAALKRQGFEVTLLKDPTGDELEAAFKKFFIDGGTDPEGRLFVWFAGHGYTIKSGDEAEGYIVPRDAPSPLTSDTEFRRKALSLRRFGEYQRRSGIADFHRPCLAQTARTSASVANSPRATSASEASMAACSSGVRL